MSRCVCRSHPPLHSVCVCACVFGLGDPKSEVGVSVGGRVTLCVCVFVAVHVLTVKPT